MKKRTSGGEMRTGMNQDTDETVYFVSDALMRAISAA